MRHNDFVNFALHGLKQGLVNGQTVACAIATALTVNDGPGCTDRVPRNHLMNRLRARLLETGGKKSSLETWITIGQRTAKNYAGDILATMDALRTDGRNAEPTSREYQAAVLAMLQAQFPTFGHWRADVTGTDKMEMSDEDKARDKLDKVRLTLSKLTSADALALLGEYATIRAEIMYGHGRMLEVAYKAQREVRLEEIIAAFAPPAPVSDEVSDEEAEEARTALAA